MSKNKRLPGKKTTCPHCGAEVFERGLKPHIRLAHKLKVREEVSTLYKLSPEALESIGILTEATKYKLQQLGIEIVPGLKNKFKVVVNPGYGNEHNEYFDTSLDAITYVERQKQLK